MLCARAADPDDEDGAGADEHTVHVWRGQEFEEEGVTQEEFVDKVIE